MRLVQQVQDLGDPSVRRFLDQVEAIRLDARSLTESLTPEQFNWRADPKRWSVGQCLLHIVLTAQQYLPAIERMIGEARTRQASGAGAYRDGVLAGWLVRSMEPPPGMRIRTPSRAIEPPSAVHRDAVLAGFAAVHDDLECFIAACAGVSLVHARMSSPFTRLVRMTLRQALALNLAHSRRHLWQAWQVRKHPLFPH
jgi:hypothetical protein